MPRAVLLAAIVLYLPAPCRAQAVRNDVVCFDGAVRSLAAAGSTLYIGGAFTRGGAAIGSVSRLDPSGAELPFPKVSGEVRAILSDGSGGWFIGGRIVAVGDSARLGVAHLRPDFTLDAWRADVDGIVYALARDGPKLIIGGEFTTVGGVSRRSLAAVDATTGTVLPWDPGLALGVSGDPPSVLSIGVGSAAWFVVGAFDRTLGATRNGLASYDRASGALRSWDPAPDDVVDQLLVQGDTVYVCGKFSNIGGQARDKLVALDAATGTPTSLSLVFGNSGHMLPPPRVAKILLAGSTLYLRGAFNSVNGYGFPAECAVDVYGGSLRSWASGSCSAMALVGPRLLLGYLTFTGRGGAVARMDTTAGASRSALGPEYNGSVLAVAGDANTILVAGSFSGTNWPDRNRLAAIDRASGALTAWTADAENEVFAMAEGGGRVYFSGRFGYVNNQPRYLVAALDQATGALTVFDAQTDNYVMTMTSTGSTIFMGGTFTSIGGQPRERLAAFDATTGALLPWAASADNEVDALAVDGATLYVGGAFSRLDGDLCPSIGAVDIASGARRAWTPRIGTTLIGFTPRVYALAARGGRVFAGGEFDTIGGAPRRRLAALDSVTAHALPWGSTGANGNVLAIALDSVAVYVGGEFDSVAAQPRSGLAALDRATGGCLRWDPHPNRTVWTILPVDSTIWVGGEFALVGGTLHSGLAALQPAASGVVGSPPPPPSPPLGTLFWLGRAHPLPTSGEVTWNYTLPAPVHVRAEIRDILGRHVATVRDADETAGPHSLHWDGAGPRGRAASGVYLLTITIPGGRAGSRIVMVH
jgi:trimeric autotransporter adhesin